MARRQLHLAGTERTDIPKPVLEAGEEWLDSRKEARRARERMNEKYFGALAVMQSHKLSIAKIVDDETKEVITLRVTNDPKLVAEKDGEVESEVGDGLPVHDGASDGGIAPGLIRQAERAQADANVEESSDGDVSVPEKAAPKQSRGRKGKKRR